MVYCMKAILVNSLLIYGCQMVGDRNAPPPKPKIGQRVLEVQTNGQSNYIIILVLYLVVLKEKYNFKISFNSKNDFFPHSFHSPLLYESVPTKHVPPLFDLVNLEDKPNLLLPLTLTLTLDLVYCAG